MKLKDISTAFTNLKIGIAYSTLEYFNRGERVGAIPYKPITNYNLTHIIDQKTTVLHVSVHSDELLILLEEPPIDWTEVPVDTKVLVRDDDCEEWLKRYYKGFIDGVYFTFINGGTSWSGGSLATWNQCKLWKEGED